MSARNTARVPRGAEPSSLKATSRKAFGQFVRIFARCGYTPRDIQQGIREECERIPAEWARRAREAPPESNDAAHILTLWFSERKFTHADGKPRALPLKGGSESVTALIRSVDRKLKPQEVLAYLIRSGAIYRTGNRYLPRGRTLILRGTRGPDYYHSLRALTNMLGTLEHNLQPKHRVPSWCEVFVENPHFPVSQREHLDRYIRDRVDKLLTNLDIYTRHRERTRRPGEPTMRVRLGVYFGEDRRGEFGRTRRTRRARTRTRLRNP